MKTTLADYCPLPITHRARAYINSHNTDIRKTFAEHTPIRVCEATPNVWRTNRSITTKGE